MPKLLIFSSGTKTGGGSGFEKLVLASRIGSLRAEVVGVVSNHENGGVRERAVRLGVPFRYFPKPRDADDYRRVAAEFGAEWFVLSGWLKLVAGLDPCRTFNIHPAPLPRFGGQGMYGFRVHKAVLAAYRRGEIGSSQVCMHFVTDEFDDGPVFFRRFVKIKQDDTAESLAVRVQATEHIWQAWVTNLVVNRVISWDGRSPDTVKFPPGYPFV